MINKEDPEDKPTNSLDRNMPTRDTPEVNGDRRASVVKEAKCCSISM
jgi:hypothetical protein